MVDENRSGTVLSYASPREPDFFDAYAPVVGFMWGWVCGISLSCLNIALMCGDEIWQPFAFLFPHPAVAVELHLTPGLGFFVVVLGIAPIVHGAYGALLVWRSRPALIVAGVLHVACYVWSLTLTDPFLG